MPMNTQLNEAELYQFHGKEYDHASAVGALFGDILITVESGDFPLTLRGKTEGTEAMYAVAYGSQLDLGLSYEQAAKKLGESIMHLNHGVTS